VKIIISIEPLDDPNDDAVEYTADIAIYDYTSWASGNVYFLPVEGNLDECLEAV